MTIDFSTFDDTEMIRRSPTRIELKLEDMQEFEFVQKADRKKVLLSCPGAEEAKKLIRQERIGYAGTVASPRQQSTSTTAVPGSRRGQHSGATSSVQPSPGPSTSTQQPAVGDVGPSMVLCLTHGQPEMLAEGDDLMESMVGLMGDAIEDVPAALNNNPPFDPELERRFGILFGTIERGPGDDFDFEAEFGS